MRREFGMFLPEFGLRSLYCATTATPGRRHTTIFRDTATSVSRVCLDSSHSILFALIQLYSLSSFINTSLCFPIRGQERHPAGCGQSERSGVQSPGLENSPLCSSAHAAGETFSLIHYQTVVMSSLYQNECVLSPVCRQIWNVMFTVV